MANERRSFPLRWVLPAGQLLVCFVVLWPLRSEFVSEIGFSIDEYRGHPRLFQFKVSPENAKLFDEYARRHPLSAEERLRFGLPPEDEHAAWVRQRRLDIPAALNLPAGLISLPYAIWGPTKHDWTPRGVDLDLWRAVSWPLMGIGLWWIVGRGIEALLAARRNLIRPAVRWFETSLGLLVLVLGAMLCMAGISHNESAFDVATAVIWILLGGAIVTARLWQWGIRV